MKRRQLIAYGALGLPLAFGALPIYLFVPDLYARSGLLGLSAIGMVLLVTRLFDAVADPCFGWLIDRYPRKPLLFTAIVPFGIGFVALFTPSFALPVDPAIWLFVSLLVCTLGFSATMIAYQAWGGDLGSNSDERLRLIGARETFILAGVVVAAVIPTLISNDPLIGMQTLPWFLGGLLIIAVGIVWLMPAGQQQIAQESLLSRLKVTWSDLAFRKLLLIFFANGVASAFPATLFVFYVTDVLAAPAQTGFLLGSYFLAAALSVPVWVRIAQWVGRPWTWIMAMLLAMAGFSGASFMGTGDWLWFLGVCIVTGLAVGTDLTIPASIVADLGEKHGATGTYFGIWNLVAKINLALAAGIALPLLAMLGYAPGNTTHTGVLIAVYVLLPLALKAVAITLLVSWRQTLTIKS